MDMRKIPDLKKGPVRHSNMPLDFVDRVRAFKQVLIEVDLATLEETLDNLSSDMHPENELLIMEHIARVYQYYISQKEITALDIKGEVFTVLLLASTGADDFSIIKLIAPDQIQYIAESYTKIYPTSPPVLYVELTLPVPAK